MEDDDDDDEEEEEDEYYYHFNNMKYYICYCHQYDTIFMANNILYSDEMIRIHPLMLHPNAAFYDLVARVHAGADSSEAWFTGRGMVVSYHPSVNPGN